MISKLKTQIGLLLAGVVCVYLSVASFYLRDLYPFSGFAGFIVFGVIAAILLGAYVLTLRTKHEPKPPYDWM